MRRTTAWCALGLFVAALVLPSLTSSHAWSDADLAGVEADLFVGHATTQIESPRGPVGPEHCALCHWLRSLGSSMAGAPTPAPPAASPAFQSVRAVSSCSILPGSTCPARAPPAPPAA